MIICIYIYKYQRVSRLIVVFPKDRDPGAAFLEGFPLYLFRSSDELPTPAEEPFTVRVRCGPPKCDLPGMTKQVQLATSHVDPQVVPPHKRLQLCCSCLAFRDWNYLGVPFMNPEWWVICGSCSGGVVFKWSFLTGTPAFRDSSMVHQKQRRGTIDANNLLKREDQPFVNHKFWLIHHDN